MAEDKYVIQYIGLITDLVSAFQAISDLDQDSRSRLSHYPKVSQD
jgi:hypothetical protein